MADLTEKLGAIGGQAGGEAGGEIGKELGEFAKWMTETLNQWKLKLIASVVGIVLLVVILNVQLFLVKLIGFKIPKLLPDMPWWEIMITGLVDLVLVMAILIQLAPLMIIASVGCTMPVLNWFAC